MTKLLISFTLLLPLNTPAYEVEIINAGSKTSQAIVRDDCGDLYRVSGQDTLDLKNKLDLLINSATFDSCFKGELNGDFRIQLEK